MSFASWSFALKSAAVSVANDTGSKCGCSPTVATSCPERSTSSAQRALLSKRDFWRAAVVATKSPSEKDRLAEPVYINRGSLEEPSSHLLTRRDRLRDRHAIRVFEDTPPHGIPHRSCGRSGAGEAHAPAEKH